MENHNVSFRRSIIADGTDCRWLRQPAPVMIGTKFDFLEDFARLPSMVQDFLRRQYGEDSFSFKGDAETAHFEHIGHDDYGIRRISH